MEENYESRRGFLRTMAMGSAALASGGFPGCDVQKNALPNIVLILADDMGYGDLECQNPESKIPTPNLNSLAGQGIRFTDAHTPSAVCTPTRYGLLTGRYSWRSRLKESIIWHWEAPLIEKDRLTIAGLLKRQGYHTACIGKWHLGWNWPFRNPADVPVGLTDRIFDNSHFDWTMPIPGGPLEYGFDYYFGDDVPNFPPYIFIENDRLQGMPTEMWPQSPGMRPGPALEGWRLEAVMPAITEKATAYIGERAKVRNTPFFLYFPLTAPHEPIVPDKAFKGMSGAGNYGDFVCEVDWAVGEVLKSLECNNLVDDTVVIFTSDNGPEYFAWDRIKEYSHYSMGELRGIKRDNWEGGHRVPFIARWPGKIMPGTTSEEIICLTDLMATISKLTNAPLSENAAEDSYNILPALLGEIYDMPIREATVHHTLDGKFAIRQGDWVYIDAPSGECSKEPEWFRKERGVIPHSDPAELFNLKNDISERKNLYARYPEKAEQLKSLLGRYKAEGRSAPKRPSI